MRLLSKKSNHATNKGAPQKGHHRSSWHVGTGHSTPRKDKEKRHRSWHFPRLSLHSMHSTSHRHSTHGISHPRTTTEDTHLLDGNKHKRIEFGKRKTFSYAAHSQGEDKRVTAPDQGTTETGLSDIVEQQLHFQNKTKDKRNKTKDKRNRPLRFFQNALKAIFPGLGPLHHPQNSAKHPKPEQHRVRGGVLLRSCATAEQHKAKVLQVIQIAKRTHGQKGLREAGFEYRLVPCPKHDNSINKDISPIEREEVEGHNDKPEAQSTMTDSEDFCQDCAHCLFHIQSNTRVTTENRKLYIADGDMYDAVANLCQENAQEIMQQKYALVWRTLCSPNEQDDGVYPMKKNRHKPIRALVNPEQTEGSYRQRPTLLIVTGKGQVRAGIFSRQHIMVTGMESSTALPLIHEARQRQLNLVIIDPNCHGEKLGMVTFERSMEKAFHHWESGQGQECDGPDCRDLFILSHSASGAQLVRYLLEKSKYYLPHIRAIAFTDATHNVQWARQRGNQPLVDLLESPACVYFRCSNPHHHCDWKNHRAGEVAPTDNFWRHRFGKVKTCWAGTKEHSLTNWTSHHCIWQHFDSFLGEGNHNTVPNLEIVSE